MLFRSSSMDWLFLSAMRQVTDQSTEDVLASLRLSMLTGPNEAYIMVKRGVFGVSLWESLSPDLKSRVTNDLAPMLFPRSPAEGAESGKLVALLSTKPEPVRQEIREALLATGLSPKEIERGLGL